MVLPNKRIQYVAYFVFLAALTAYCYSFFCNRWYRVEYNIQLQDSFVQIKHYSEGLLSVCWFGDCINLGVILKQKSLKNIYVSRLLMLCGIWTVGMSFIVTVYKLHFVPDWYENRTLFFVIGIVNVVSGIIISSATFYYLYFHQLAVNRIGYFDFGCYIAWLSGTLFIVYGLLIFAFTSSVLVPLDIDASSYASAANRPQIKEMYRNTDRLSPSLFQNALLSGNRSTFTSSNIDNETIPSSLFDSHSPTLKKN